MRKNIVSRLYFTHGAPLKPDPKSHLSIHLCQTAEWTAPALLSSFVQNSNDSLTNHHLLGCTCATRCLILKFGCVVGRGGSTGNKFNRRFKVRVQVVLNNFSATELCKLLAALPHNTAKYDSIPATKWTSRFSGIKGRGKGGRREGTAFVSPCERGRCFVPTNKYFRNTHGCFFTRTHT